MSGEDAKAAKKLGLQALTPDKVPKDTPFKEPAILIPYFDITGAKTKFWRVRYLKQPEPKGFGKLTKRKPSLCSSSAESPRGSE